MTAGEVPIGAVGYRIDGGSGDYVEGWPFDPGARYKSNGVIYRATRLDHEGVIWGVPADPPLEPPDEARALAGWREFYRTGTRPVVSRAEADVAEFAARLGGFWRGVKIGLGLLGWAVALLALYAAVAR